ETMPNLLARMGHKGSEQLRLDVEAAPQHLREGLVLRTPDVPGPRRLQVEVPVAEGSFVIHPLHRGSARLDRAIEDAQEPRVDSPVILPGRVLGGRESEPFPDAG